MAKSNPVTRMLDRFAGEPTPVVPETDPVVSAVKKALQELELDVTQRNTYMDTRDSALYGEGLWRGLDVPMGTAEYNYLPRVVDIHSAQLMGRGFNLYSYYNKTDIPDESPDGDPAQLDLLQKQARAQNKLKKGNADARKRAIDAMIRDNGGMDPFKRGARQGSALGECVYKSWFDKKAKKMRIVLLENVQNYRAGYSDNNFRERDFDAYVYQISLSNANRQFGDLLKPGQNFETTKAGAPFTDIQTGLGVDSANGTFIRTDRTPEQTGRAMVTVMEFTGYLEKFGASGDNVVPVEPGKEQRFNVLVVGGVNAQTITKDEDIPMYWPIANRTVLGRSWGDSDLPQSALDINRDVIQLMADQLTYANKNLFKPKLGIGMTPQSIPKLKPRKSVVVPLSPEQDLREMVTSNGSLDEWNQLVQQRLEAFVRVTGVGRVLFDDPSVNSDSNQALLTTLKGVIDIVEDKQSRWEPVLLAMFDDALRKSAKHIPAMKPFVEEEEDWFLCLEWPSVLRREDATYQTMWLNLFNANVISIDTYHEKIGLRDSSEEIDRIKDNMEDWITAAVMAKTLGTVATQTMYKELHIDPAMMNLPKITLRGDLSPAEAGNIASKAGADAGPYAPATGPQGIDGMIANDTVTNAGAIANPDIHDPQPVYQHPNPTQTADNNQGAAPTSQPGSGATSVSPAGAVNQANQQAGR